MAAPDVVGGGAGFAPAAAGGGAARQQQRRAAFTGVPAVLFLERPRHSRGTERQQRGCPDRACTSFRQPTASAASPLPAVRSRSAERSCPHHRAAEPPCCLCAPRYKAAIHHPACPLRSPIIRRRQNAMWLRTETSVIGEAEVPPVCGGGFTAQPATSNALRQQRAVDFTSRILCGNPERSSQPVHPSTRHEAECGVGRNGAAREI